MLALVAIAGFVLADGGAILLRKQSGPFLVTVFGAPRAGASEISVLVQRGDGSPVLDSEVEIRTGDTAVRALHGANKLMYTAEIQFARPGKVPITITVGGIQVNGELQVERRLVYWPYFALVPVMVALFALNQWLKSKRRAL